MIAPLSIQTRPAEIVWATVLLCLSLAIGAIKVVYSLHLFQLTAQDVIGLPLIIILGLYVLLIWKIWQGRNWARSTLAIVLVIGLLRTATAFIPMPGLRISRVLAILHIVQLVIVLCALLLVYGSKAQNWFQPRETPVL
jgi:hypothetical protein